MSFYQESPSASHRVVLEVESLDVDISKAPEAAAKALTQRTTPATPRWYTVGFGTSLVFTALHISPQRGA